ncbi:unnamed protein product, partial [Vitis vinifera]|uniref:Uncharacterized protein n=1 Tax=Vitis vinifera TaxID=29760 RepID=D7SN82_VITVI
MIKNIFNRSITSKKFFDEDDKIIFSEEMRQLLLASWLRLKYPHVALGALASSAPILYFDDITPQNEASEICYNTIRESWSEIDKVASEPDGLSILSKKFRTCTELSTSDELKDYLDETYSVAAQYNHPPRYPVTVVCGGIDGAPEGSDK